MKSLDIFCLSIYIPTYVRGIPLLCQALSASSRDFHKRREDQCKYVECRVTRSDMHTLRMRHEDHQCIWVVNGTAEVGRM